MKKCSGCKSEIESCDGCGKDFKKGQKILCDELTGEHFCKVNCSTDLRMKTVQEKILKMRTKEKIFFRIYYSPKNV